MCSWIMEMHKKINTTCRSSTIAEIRDTQRKKQKVESKIADMFCSFFTDVVAKTLANKIDVRKNNQIHAVYRLSFFLIEINEKEVKRNVKIKSINSTKAFIMANLPIIK